MNNRIIKLASENYRINPRDTTPPPKHDKQGPSSSK